MWFEKVRVWHFNKIRKWVEVSFYFLTLSRVLTVWRELCSSKIADIGMMKVFSFFSVTASLIILCVTALLSPVSHFEYWVTSATRNLLKLWVKRVNQASFFNFSNHFTLHNPVCYPVEQNLLHVAGTFAPSKQTYSKK